MHIYGYVAALILFVATMVSLAHGNYPAFVILGIVLFGLCCYAWINYYLKGAEW